MIFPNGYGPELHLAFEAFAYVIGVQLYMARAPNITIGERNAALIAIAAILGAAAGSKILYWSQFPAHAFANFPDWTVFIGGKTIVGGLLGGLIGVELCKKILGVTQSTGDAYAIPLTIGILIGRIGCFLAGIEDHTYGSPTSLPWGIDFCDGYLRHPTQLYEIIFLALLWVILQEVRFNPTVPGDQFRLMMNSYLIFRFLIDFIKPPFLEPNAEAAKVAQPHLYFNSVTAIQIACLGGLLYYAHHLTRLSILTLNALTARKHG